MKLKHVAVVCTSEENADRFYADLHFEIFIYNGKRQITDRIEHTCIEVKDLDDFLAKCRDLDVEINNIPREGKPLTFISDYDGNLFEVKG